ncbi:translation initiation factor IF-2-like [Panthera leo]|uniref:translation initiation factor IF-2-like n=1 Tax=Panthera leo TaxID=9689 RepID=UPI001C699B01|nr:translation initiation factor IF-2-like [Panthera leo]
MAFPGTPGVFSSEARMKISTSSPTVRATENERGDEPLLPARMFSKTELKAGYSRPKDGLVKERFCPEAFSAGITGPGPEAPREGVLGARGEARRALYRPSLPRAGASPAGPSAPRGHAWAPSGVGRARPGRPTPRHSRLASPPPPAGSPTPPPACPVRAAPSSLTTPAPGRAQRSHRRPEPGDLTSGRSRRQRTPSWDSAHPGATGSRKVRPREARNELCNRQGPQARTEAAARGTSASRARPATQAGSPLATGPHVGAPPPDAAAARSRRRHLRSWQPSREARRPAQAQTSRIPTAMETEALRG